MFYWMKPLPELQIDYNEYKPFIKNDWFRSHYMWFAYGLMILLGVLAWFTGGFRAGNLWIKILIYCVVYPLHELCHISVALPKGDVYMTHSGLYFWLTPNFPMRKWHFWVYMTLPFIVFTVLPVIGSIFAPEPLRAYLIYIAWINAITAGSDIINSVLIMIKPVDSRFYRGYYRRVE